MNIAEKFTTIAENEPKVYEAGKADNLAEQWNIITQDRTRGVFQYAFNRWKDTDFSPLEGIKITNAFWMFSYCNVTELDFDLDLSKATSINNMLYSCDDLKRVKKIILNSNGAGTTAQVFTSNKSLEYIRFEGFFNNTVDFGDCPLDAFSILGDPATEEQIANGKNLLYFGGVYYYGGIMGALMDEPTATNPTVTFKESIVNTHFGGVEGDMWLHLIATKPKWNFAVKK